MSRRLLKNYWGNKANYNYYLDELNIFEEVRQDPDNPELIQVRCFNSNCKRWFNPTNLQVYNRIHAFRENLGKNFLQKNFYCSEECKDLCPAYKFRFQIN